jgi:RNA polymerase sigma-70 factor (ECF subfamily)
MLEGMVMFAITTLHSGSRCPGRAPDRKTIQFSQEASDSVLIRAVAAGDKRALHALYARHKVRVFRFILRMIDDRSLAEDLVSEVPRRQAPSRGFQSEVASFHLVIGLCPLQGLSALRRRSDEHLDDDVLAMIEDPADDPETLVEKEDRRAIVQNCLAQLSPTHREVLDLVYYHEKSVNEVAEIVGIPANTVKTRMFYARTRMEKFLKLAGVDAF